MMSNIKVLQATGYAHMRLIRAVSNDTHVFCYRGLHLTVGPDDWADLSPLDEGELRAFNYWASVVLKTTPRTIG
jgi:hypothetical protein